MIRAHHAAGPVRRVDHHQIGDAALQLERSREPRDARADDHRTHFGSRHAQTVLLKMGLPERRCAGR